ncbi:unnamed protein product [Symbiodinium natans]|uniref:Uncharacterized protein n=1 Tax=Symbiodinium natans TaxID=878477 RepID=A0A812M676_9DINO|nr:unnamed protein product [Symbiodinium natans]
MAMSMEGYVWAAPLKWQMMVQPAGAPTYAWGWQPAPVVVTRRTIRVVARPVQAPGLVTRRTIRVVVKPASVVVKAAAAMQLPHLLGPPRAPAVAHPKTGLPQAGAGEPAPDDSVELTEAPVDVTDACETMEATNAVAEALAPAPELVYPKGRPVSYGPARPFMELQDETACQADADVPEAAPKPAIEPVPEPAEDASPPPELPQELPGQAEALEALQALMAELGGMGFKVPKKPMGEPEVGDLVVLSDTILPKSLRLRYAVVMQVHEKHYTARTLAEDKATSLEECWPFKEDAVLESTVGRLGSRVRVAEGSYAGCSGKVAKAPGHPIFPVFRQFRNGKVQYVVNVRLDDGRDAQCLFSELRAERAL